MASFSGSPRSRVDQFFASRKRMPSSTKNAKTIEDSKNRTEVSPNAKGTLDGYLVKSPDARSCVATQRLTERCSPLKSGIVKRNLTREINLDSDVQGKPISPCRSSSGGESPLKVGDQRRIQVGMNLEASVDSIGPSDTYVGDKTAEVPSEGTGNLELRSFAADFLSLYCSELPSAVRAEVGQKLNGHKRSCSPSLLAVNSKLCIKKQCTTVQEDFPIEVVNLPSEGCPDIEGSSLRFESKEAVVSYSRELGVVAYESSRDTNIADRESFSGLRKCSNTAASGLHVGGCYTPASTSVSRSRKTPKSAYRSSILSPGEEFWNEAIQVADCLFVPVGKSSLNGFDADKGQIELDHLKGDRSCNKLVEDACCAPPPQDTKNIIGKKNNCEARPQDLGVSLRLTNKDIETVPQHNEASPLPVRHFDFTREENNFDEDKGFNCQMNDAIHPENGKANTGYGNAKITERSNVLCYPEAPADSVEKPKSSATSMGMTDDISFLAGELPKVSDNRSNVKAEECKQTENSVRGTVLNDEDWVHVPALSCNSPDEDEEIRRCSTVNFKYDVASTPSSFMPLKDSLQLCSWLPSEICSVYMKKGISKLYPWQVDCLQVDGVLERRNLVYCASTSAGKSFVAEVLILRRIISTGKMALLVLPYVSICAEKAEHLELLLEPLGKHVRSFYGNQGSGSLPKDTSVAVCTIEKANFLINRLLEEGRLSEVGIVVIDELHMVGDQHRGYLLELLLTKLRYASGEGNAESCSEETTGTSSGKSDLSHGLQIVGMSATMPNVAAVADWLHAALYQTDFRPVPLEEYIKVGNNIFSKKLDVIRTIPKVADLGGKDPDHIVKLCDEVVQEGHSVLLFCSSRKGCESTARHVAKFLKAFSVSTCEAACEYSDSASVLEALRRCPAGLDPVLEETIPSGIAYHHAGLTVEEREIVETCYRKGLIRVLTATSTLAAGVNLPARRVIFRQPRIGRDFIDGTRYRQMAGRAGRTGIDTRGESILICKQEEVKRITAMLNDCCPPLQSCLSDDKNGMTHAILEVVAGGIVQTASDIHRYVRCTLLNSTKPFEAVVKSAQDSLRWLCHSKFLEWNEQTQLYTATPLGHASFGSSLSPEESLVVLDDLSRAREGFVLASDLHLVYLVTPINVDVEPNWDLYYGHFMQLSILDQSVGNRVGVTEPFLMRMAHGAPMHHTDRLKGKKKQHGGLQAHVVVRDSRGLSDDQTLRIAKRFYVALMLSRLVQEVPMYDVCEAFKVARGMIQVLQENSGRFASLVSLFCERLGWHDLGGLIAKFQNRVSFGVRSEIAELTNIPYVKGSRARALYKAGLRTPLAIAESSIPTIAKALFESSSWNAQEGTSMRYVQLGLAKKIKNGACKIVLDQAEEARMAAFSAFKSLGVDIPQLSQPLLPTNFKGTLQIVNMPSSGLDTSSGSDNVPDKVTQLGAALGSNNETDHTICPNMAHKMVNEMGCSISSIGEDKSLKVTCNSVNSCLSIKVPSPNCAPAVNLSPEKENREASSFTDMGNAGTHDGASVKPDQDEFAGGHTTGCTSSSTSKKGPINANAIHGGFDSFLDQWDAVREFYFDVHFAKRSELNSLVPFEIFGIAVCWQESPVYYINLSRDLIASGMVDPHNGVCGTSDDAKAKVPSPEKPCKAAIYRWERVSKIMGRSGVRKFTWNLKHQIQVLRNPGTSVQRFGGLHFECKGMKLVDNSHILLPSIAVHDGIDLCLVAWILWPDEESRCSPNLEKIVKKRLTSEAAAAANRDGRWRNQMRRAAPDGCCRRVAQVRALSSVLWKMLVSENLINALSDIENPLVKVLADMELWGIGVNMEACLQARQILGRKLKELEKEAYKLAGRSFSFYTSSDIAHVLYNHLKLPIPEGTKGKQHPSTDKHSLDLLRGQHPIVAIIKEHRTLAKLLSSTLGSICSRAKLCMESQKYVIRGHWLQTSTATGRLSMEEPNLQCVEHTVELILHCSMEEHHQINARDFFIPTQESWMLLTADYSQIELRLMAHFSQDSSLIELLSKPDGDIFTTIAARWTGKLEYAVSSQEREQTKRLIYGILYGMGANTLAEQLECSSEDAAEKIRSFKDSFPGVSAWLRDAVASCRSKGYVQTLKGRKRFLSKINFGNNKEKAKAQRQAVNSICQGSAADIIKIAMINIHSFVVEGHGSNLLDGLEAQYSMLKGRCHILLQVHDELVLEVDPSLVREAGLLLQSCMENAVTLLVPLRVKLKVGRTWGSFEPLNLKLES